MRRFAYLGTSAAMSRVSSVMIARIVALRIDWDPRASKRHQGPSRICLPNIRRYSLQLMAMDGAHCISFDGQRAWSANLTLIAIAGPWCTYAECFPLPHHRLRDARTEAIQRSLLVHPPRLVAARMGTILLPRRISPRRPVTLLQHLVKRY